ncbi:MAG: hypothetical protein AAGA58_00945 [Verrucomicrobiota bacterium]
MTIEFCEADADGGGIYTYDGGSTTLSDSIVKFCSATNGGGLYAIGFGTTLDLLSVCGIQGNEAADGGGIYNGVGSTLNVALGSIAENFATSEGGGLYNTVLADAVVSDGVIAGNRAVTGGGIYTAGGSSTLSLEQCSVAANLSTSGGGGIHNAGSTITVNESVIALNRSLSAAPDIQLSSGSISNVSTNFLGINSTVSSTFPEGFSIGTAANPKDPVLGPPGYYGGGVITMIPLANSPLIDQISATRSLDARGYPGDVDGNANGLVSGDIGGVEAGPIILVDQPSDDLGMPGRSLRLALAQASQPGTRIQFDPSVFNGEFSDIIAPNTSIGALFGPLDLPDDIHVHIDATNLTAPVDILATQLRNNDRLFEMGRESSGVSFHGLIIRNAPLGLFFQKSRPVMFHQCDVRSPGFDGLPYENLRAHQSHFIGVLGDWSVESSVRHRFSDCRFEAFALDFLAGDASHIFERCSFRGETINEALTLGSGAILSNCTFEGNGTAVRAAFKEVTLSHCTFFNNSITVQYGSPTFPGADVSFDIENSLFLENSTNDTSHFVPLNGGVATFSGTSNIVSNRDSQTDSFFDTGLPNAAGNYLGPFNLQDEFVCPPVAWEDRSDVSFLAPDLLPIDLANAPTWIIVDDARGAPRLLGTLYDIGAVESALEVTNYHDWAALNIPPQLNRDFDGDAEEDNVANGAEYTLGTHPMLKGKNGLRLPVFDFTNFPTEFEVTFGSRAGITDARWGLQSTDNLQHFTPLHADGNQSLTNSRILNATTQSTLNASGRVQRLTTLRVSKSTDVKRYYRFFAELIAP